jgi:hypothetical protein
MYNVYFSVYCAHHFQTLCTQRCVIQNREAFPSHSFIYFAFDFVPTPLYLPELRLEERQPVSPTLAHIFKGLPYEKMCAF